MVLPSCFGQPCTFNAKIVSDFVRPTFILIPFPLRFGKCTIAYTSCTIAYMSRLGYGTLPPSTTLAEEEIARAKEGEEGHLALNICVEPTRISSNPARFIAYSLPAVPAT